jgi:UDP-3-O-[3-hydroxymyristoyl] N-acetylglucosamine deacetylase
VNVLDPRLKDDRIVKRVNFRFQRTIAQPVEVEGIGYLTGQDVHLRFRPAPASTGVVFVRTDLGPQACIHASVDEVTGTNRRTTLGQPPLSVGLVEHVMAALSGLRVDNCIVEVDAPEPPGLDGSAGAFVQALTDAGMVMQAQYRGVWAVDRPIVVASRDATLALYPPTEPGLRVSYLLNYGLRSPITRQTFTSEVTPASFAQGIAPCRTFLLEEEAIALRNQGLGKRTQARDLLVFGPRGPIDNTLRFADEPARHKVLDILGDLALLGHDLHGHVVAYRSGHPLNIELVRALSQGVCQVLPRQRLAA